MAGHASSLRGDETQEFSGELLTKAGLEIRRLMPDPRLTAYTGAPGSHRNDDPRKHSLSWKSLWINSETKES